MNQQSKIKRFIKQKIIRIFDFLASPTILLSSVLLRTIRRKGINRFPISKKIFYAVGVYPILDHYSEPLFNVKHLRVSLSKDRKLPGIDWNVEEQLRLLDKFDYNNELILFPKSKSHQLEFYYHNNSFGTGDSEYLYNIIRHNRPQRIIEIGGGNSTLMAINAINKNFEEDPEYSCQHICIEPFESPWLEQTSVQIIRKKVEELSPSYFQQLEKNDLLFIDSSHIIRPQGDVLFLYLEILPIIKKGVIVHVHDIFSPKDYLQPWINDFVRFWNEQYLLEAFLCNNRAFKIIAALNFLHHNHFEKLASKCPNLVQDREPGSFYIVKK